MKTKEELLDKFQVMDQNHYNRMIELEVQIDIRDQLVRLADVGEAQNPVNPNWHDK